LYAPPALRSARDPSPFDQIVRRQPLRILVDQPLTVGPVDGEGEYSGYALAGSGSTGFPDACTVLRSYLRHPAFEVLFVADELDEEGAVVFGEPPQPADDLLPVRVKTAIGMRHAGIGCYAQAVEEALGIAARHQLDDADARAGVLFHRLGSELQADLVITGRRWLLAERGSPGGRNLASVVSAEEALAVTGLYLRWHNQPVIVGGAAIRWDPASMRRSAAFVALPAFERWNQAGRARCDTDGDPTLESLNQTCLTRMARGSSSAIPSSACRPR